jgi:hypothetical protein
MSFKTTLPEWAIWPAKENYVAITQIKLCGLCVFELRWLSGTLITLVTLWADYRCHTAILFSDLELDNLNKKRTFKGRFYG